MITNTTTTVTASILPIGFFALVKKHLRIDIDFLDEDDLIQAYINTAVVQCENYIGGHISTKTVVINTDGFDNPLVLNDFPVKSVSSVSYLPALSTVTYIVMPSTDYKLAADNNKHFCIYFLKTLPYTLERYDALSISYTVGYDVLPLAIQQAIFLMVGAMYEGREDETKTTFQRISSANNLLNAYKKF